MLIVDFQVPKDEDWTDAFALVDGDGQPVSLVDAVLELVVKRDDAPAAPDVQTVLTASSATGDIVISDAASGQFNLNISLSVVETIPAGRHNHVLRVLRGASKKRLWSGSATFTEGFA